MTFETISKQSDRTAPRGATSTLSGPHAADTRGKILQMRLPANVSHPTGAASVAPSFIPAKRSPSEGFEPSLLRIMIWDCIAAFAILISGLPIAAAISWMVIVGFYYLFSLE